MKAISDLRDANLGALAASAGSTPGVPVATHQHFITAQVINTQRNALALRPFRVDEFGTEAAGPSKAHIAAANRLIIALRRRVAHSAAAVDQEAEVSATTPTTRNLQALLQQKQQADQRIKAVEKIWKFYLELFGQRQSRFAEMLLGTDRIALDCYQALYTGLDNAKSIPSPAPFSYMETGFTPATYRRGVRLTRLGRNMNPFPIVQLPYHRLINPWTLGAVHHEVAHNLQSDLGLWQEVPQRVIKRLLQAGIPPAVAQVWGRWHKETWADLCGVLLGGPGVVASLLDVLGRTPRSALHFHAAGVHPTPYLRALINTELLRRMGFAEEAQGFNRLWFQMYPNPQQGVIPDALLESFLMAHRLVVDTMCYQPYRQLGNKPLAAIFSFNAHHDAMTREAAQRIAQGVDPGIIPARFLIGAARHALDQQLAPAATIARNFYQALGRR